MKFEDIKFVMDFEKDVKTLKTEVANWKEGVREVVRRIEETDCSVSPKEFKNVIMTAAGNFLVKFLWPIQGCVLFNQEDLLDGPGDPKDRALYRQICGYQLAMLDIFERTFGFNVNSTEEE